MRKGSLVNLHKKKHNLTEYFGQLVHSQGFRLIVLKVQGNKVLISTLENGLSDRNISS